MCVVSNVGDYWKDVTWPNRYQSIPIDTITSAKPIDLGQVFQDVEKLKKEVEELKKLLLAAKAYDEALGEPHCETDEKVALIKKLAELVGVDMKEVFS